MSVLTYSKQFLTFSFLLAVGSITKAETIILNFYYGSEKKEWIDKTVEDFNKRSAQGEFTTLSGGLKIRVNAVAKGSGDLVDLAAQPNPLEKVHVASPASQLYVRLANARYAKDHAGKRLLSQERTLVNSPVVIAMWETEAIKMGWPTKQLSWKDVMLAAQKNASFKFGHTNPHRSNSGLSALVAQYYAGYQQARGEKARVLTEKHVQDPAIEGFVQDVQKTMSLYGESTGFYARQLVEGGPNSLSAAVIYESDVVARNQQIAQLNLSRGKDAQLPKLIAIYPEEGTFATDHPFAIVNREWTTDDHKEAAEVFGEFLMTPENQQLALTMGFRPELAMKFDLKAVFNSDSGTSNSSDISYLQVPSGEVLELILMQWSRLKNNSKSVVIFDRSGSMGRGPGRCETRGSFWNTTTNGVICAAREGVKEILTNLGQRDSTLLMSFSHYFEINNNNMSRWLSFTPGQQVQFTPLDEGMREKGKELFDQLTPDGGTAMYTAIGEAHRILCQDIKTTGKNDRSIRAIFVLTDGLDQNSEGQFGTADRLIRSIGYLNQGSGDLECKIRVFGIAYNVDLRNSDSAAIFDNLKRITKSTGGDAVIGSPDKIKEIFKKLGDFL